ncbi:FAD/NAD(P)-binding protein [Salinithrix halophila]|uniref:FAD/NAD(P)-binding protein n=1 Tax=Salinithrix halophila TaxID=1485204 RepID=A0ABV8JJ37_9BACL
MDQGVKMAIVGGGAACVCYFHYLVKYLLQMRSPIRVEVTIFEKEKQVGPGLAYQKDYPILRLNRSSQSMSAIVENPSHFWSWYQDHILSRTHGKGEEFLPRSVFGQYLQEVFHQTMQLANREPLQAKIEYNEIVDVNKINRKIELITQSGESSLFDFVVLCTGHNPSRDPYQLKGTPRYNHQPYPLHETLESIRPDEEIGMIGSSLTAVDTALALQERKHQGRIRMFSRQGLLPSVRIKHAQPHQLRFLKREVVYQLVEKKGHVLLKELLRLLKQEFNSLEGSREMLLSQKTNGSTAMERLRQELSQSDTRVPWQSILTATNDIIEEMWHHLNAYDKRMFMERFHRYFMTIRNPMPIVNAERIYEMLRSGQLIVHKGLKSIRYWEGSFQVSLSEKSTLPITSDWIINATGPAQYIVEKQASRLVQTLLAKGFAVKDPFGGIQTNFNTGAVISRDGYADLHFRALGQITCGTYYYTGSLEMIAKRSRKLARDLSHMIEDKVMVEQGVC